MLVVQFNVELGWPPAILRSKIMNGIETATIMVKIVRMLMANQKKILAVKMVQVNSSCSCGVCETLIDQLGLSRDPKTREQ